MTDQDIAAVVSRWTGMPVERMLEGEREKLINMEEAIGARVIGQAEAVKAVSSAVRRAAPASRPQPSARFIPVPGPYRRRQDRADQGSRGVLSTIRRRWSGSICPNSWKSMPVARPSGLHQAMSAMEGGVLTEAVPTTPYQVVLFDEVEKAHGDVFNILLQVLDDGRLTDGQGRTVDFTNTIIILTSNLGSQYLASLGEDENPTNVEAQVMEVVRAPARPEFLNRLDEIILFHRLSAGHMGPIVDIQVRRLQQLLDDPQDQAGAD